MNKKTTKIISLMVFILFMAAGCKKSEELFPPTILLVNETGYIHSDTSLASGDDIRIKLLLQKGDLNMTNFLIDVYTDSVSRYFDTGMNTEYLMWEGVFIKTLSPLEEWKFMVFDREGNATVTSLKISLDTSAQYTPLISFSPIGLGAQDNQQYGGCYNLTDNIMYFHQAVASDTALQHGIDLLCYYDDTDNATIASPGANIVDGIFPINPNTWIFKNTTRYMKTSLSMEDFNSAMNDSIIIANYDEGEAKRKAKQLKVDDIYTFRTESGRLGIFKVNAVEGTSDGSVSISLKTQP